MRERIPEVDTAVRKAVKKGLIGSEAVPEVGRYACFVVRGTLHAAITRFHSSQDFRHEIQ